MLNTLISNRIITLPYNYKPYEPKVKPKFWNDNQYCIYDRNKGHKTKNYMKLKYIIQDLIEVDGLITNTDHKVFNEPRYPSMNKQKFLERKIGCKDQLHMIESTYEKINMIRSKGKKEGYK